ncbi:ATP-binding protein [Ureaplasma canigenitalium]|uniref:ATP-binding protein n=1 Tax=Ureaplasma canigenitalium TaxID=42092 RepID=UPI0004E20E07|nr:ATP-binding protein [Ureaplasma canigenitalium]
MVIKRDFYLNKIISKMGNKRIKIITGIRRCGKSYLLFNLFKDYLISSGIKNEQIISISLDEIDNIEYRNPFKLNEYIKNKCNDKTKQYYILIDEIQLADSIKNPYTDKGEQITFVDVLLGLMKNENLDIYVTGSNSRMLSFDILTQFRDRGDEIHILPLCFKEITSLFPDKDKAFDFYTIYGGMPYIYNLKTDEEKGRYLKDLFAETYIKDILERNKIQGNGILLDILINFIASSIGSLTNPTKLAYRFLSTNKIKIASNTISNYLSYFKDAYVLYQAHRYDVKGGRYFNTPSKFYFSDIGLRNARLNFRQIEINHIMENIIYNELKRYDYNVDVGLVEYERKEGEQRKKVQLEVDFIINKGQKKYYIQSALNIDNNEKREQEINSLLKINDSFKKIVIVKDSIIPRYDENGILYLGIKEFLLDISLIDF